MSKIKVQSPSSGTAVFTLTTASGTTTDRTISLPDSTGTVLMTDGDGSALTGIDAVIVSTTAPTSPTAGDMWFNSSASIISTVSSKTMGVWSGTEWHQMSNVPAAITSTSGTVTTPTIGGVNYKLHTFTSSSTFVYTAVGGHVFDVLVVGGGGGAGWHSGAGGGAGGLIWQTSKLGVSGSVTVTIGSGGPGVSADGSGTNGGDTVFGTLIAKGGGGGGHFSVNSGRDGGSGGGGARSTGTSGSATQPTQSGDSGTYGFGNDGGSLSSGGDSPNYPAHGGGGAGSAGSAGTQAIGGAGGSGKDLSSFLGTTYGVNGIFAGGGGGSLQYGGANNGGPGGSGGGGLGGSMPGGSSGANGVINTGGGQGGHPHASSGGGLGGSGIVIVRYTI